MYEASAHNFFGGKMTLFDLINNLPHWLRIVVYVVLAIWSFEMFLLPFKFNIRNNRLAQLIKLQEDTLKQIQQKNKQLDETYTLLSQVMGSMFRTEQNGRK